MVHKRKIIYSALFLLVLIPVVIFILSRFSNTGKKITSAAKLESLTRVLENTFEKDIEKTAEDYIFAKDGEYAILIKDLTTKDTYSYNENKVFESASLYKLWVMGVAFQKINEGVLSEDETLSAPITKLDEILTLTTPTPSPSEEPSPTPTPTTEPVFVNMMTKDAIEKMITVSDNYAALLIASRSGSLSVTNFLKDNELNNSNFRQPPKTTAKDLGKYFEKLYQGKIVNSNYSEKMLEILKKQTINDRIPKYLPKGIAVAHKTGELKEYKHDGGIVFTKKGDYIIIVLSNTSDPARASEKIAKFSKAIYDYFDK